VIHGKPKHEETRATFSHSAQSASSVIVRDLADAKNLAAYIRGEKPSAEFYQEFERKYSKGFDVEKGLRRVGVVNQTTMLATETQEIADYLRSVMIEKFGIETIRDHFADTRDTLCYATNDNQDSTYQLLETDADLAIVVGGYNSSNTSHIVELCERKFSTFFINSESEIKSATEIHHFNYPKKIKEVTHNFIPRKEPLKIILTSGASCPDTLVDRVLLRLLDFFPGALPIETVLKSIG
jgi:4-hydroxy-3-methylbut-2-enyl diphosphate reductase